MLHTRVTFTLIFSGQIKFVDYLSTAPPSNHCLNLILRGRKNSCRNLGRKMDSDVVTWKT